MNARQDDNWEDEGEGWKGESLNPDRDSRGEEYKTPLPSVPHGKRAVKPKAAEPVPSTEVAAGVGKPPKPRPQWRYKVVVGQKLHHLHHGSKFLLNGVLLRYQGSASWSECHYEYSVFPPRELKQKSGSDPIAVVMALAERLKLELHEVRCELSGIEYSRVPDGFCAGCWHTGRRIVGRPHQGSGHHAGMVVDLCAAHAHKFGRCDWRRI